MDACVQGPTSSRAVQRAFRRTSLKSQFSPTGDSRGRSRRHPDDLLAFWSELDRVATYPLDDLVPALRLGEAARVGG